MMSARPTFALFAALMLLVKTSSAGPCDSGPCKNNGGCIPLGNSFTCICIPNYTGSDCGQGQLACFTANATVVLESGRHIPIQDVAVGDSLLSFDNSGKLFFSKVATWMDRVPDVKLDVIQLTTQTGKTIKATPYHVIRVGDSYLRMRDVKVGDELLVTDDGKQMHKEKVESIVELNDGVGAYAPLTHEGTIVVNGVAASCYAYSHQLGQLVFAPLKLMSTLGVVSGNTDGTHWYSKMLIDWTQGLGMSDLFLA